MRVSAVGVGVVALVGLAAPAGRPFEGVLRYGLTLQGGSGAVTTSIGPLGVHSAASVTYLDRRQSTTVVVRSSDPSVTWVKNEGEARFSRLSATSAPPRTFSAVKGPPAVVARVPCTTVRLTSSEGIMDYCVAPAFLGERRQQALVSAAQRLAPDVQAALTAAGVSGLVVRLAQTSPDGGVTTLFELLEARPGPVPRALFSVDQ